MTIGSDEEAYAFDALPIEHKIGFYWKNLHLDSVTCMAEWQDPEVRAKYGYALGLLVNRAANEVEGIRAVNWMKALLHQDGFARIES
jgi:hypothetical protein